MDGVVKRDRRKVNTFVCKCKNKIGTIKAHIVFCGKEKCEKEECCLECREMLSYIEFVGSGIGDALVFFRL